MADESVKESHPEDDLTDEVHHQTFVSRKARESIVPPTETMTELQYVSINEHFGQLLTRCAEDESLKTLCPEISYLLNRFKALYSIQRQLTRKVSELTIQIALKDREEEHYKTIVQEKEDVIQSLKIQIEQFQSKLGEFSKQKDDAVRKLDEVTTDLRLLKQEAAAREEARANSDSATVALRKQMRKLREDMIVEKEVLQSEIGGLKKNLAESEKVKATVQLQLEDSSKMLKKCEENLLATQTNLQSELKHKNKTDREMLDIRQDVKVKTENIKQLNIQLTNFKSQLALSETKLKKYEDEYRKFKNASEELSKDLDKLKLDLNIREDKIVTLTAEKEKIQAELKSKLPEMLTLKQEIMSLRKDKYTVVKHVASLESFKTEAQGKIELLIKEMNSSEKTLGEAVKEVSQCKKQISRAEKEKVALANNIVKHQEYMKLLNSQIAIKDEINKTTCMALATTQAKLDREKKKLKDSGIEKDRLIVKVRELTIQLKEHKDEISLREKKLKSIQNEVFSLESKLKNEIEGHKETSDILFRCKKVLEETKLEVSKEKAKIASADSYVELLKGNIRNLEVQYSARNEENKKLESEITALKNQLTKQMFLVVVAEEESCKKDKEISVLHKDLLLKGKANQRLQKELILMTEDRNLMSSLLTNKEAALHKLKEALKLNDLEKNKIEEESTLIATDMRLLKSQLMQESRKRGLLEKKVSSLPILRRELSQTQQLLTTEKLRTKAMEVDTSKPVNVHRMRILAGTDPDKHELLLKNMFLQKKLVKKDAKLGQKAAELEECQKTLSQLRDRLSQQPSSDTFKKLGIYRAQCQELKGKCDSLTAQVHMYESYYADFKNENAKLKEQLNHLKTTQYKKQLKKRSDTSK